MERAIEQLKFVVEPYVARAERRDGDIWCEERTPEIRTLLMECHQTFANTATLAHQQIMRGEGGQETQEVNSLFTYLANVTHFMVIVIYQLYW